MALARAERLTRGSRTRPASRSESIGVIGIAFMSIDAISLDEINARETIGGDYDACCEQAEWFNISEFDPVWVKRTVALKALAHFFCEEEDLEDDWVRVQQLATAYRDDADVPPVIVVHHGLDHPEAPHLGTGRAYTCIDGLHRVNGARLARQEAIPAWVAEISPRSPQDA
jgi:hypothetical protein